MRIRIAVCLTCLWIIIAALVIHQQESLHPTLSMTIFLSVIVILWAINTTDISKNQYYCFLIGLISLSIFYRTFPIVFIDGIIGVDPHWYAIQTQSVINTGSTDAIDGSFYSDAPLYIVFLTVIVEISGIAVEKGNIGISLILAILLPLISALIVQHLTPERYAISLIAASIMVVEPMSLRYAYWPIAQSHAIILFAISLITIMIFYDNKSTPGHMRLVLCLVVLLAGLSYTHKLPILIIILTLILIIFISVITGSSSNVRGLIITLLSIVILVVIWVFVTDFAINVLLTASELVSRGVVLYSSPTDPLAATRTGTGLLAFLGRNLHWLVLTLLGGFGCIYSYFYTDDMKNWNKSTKLVTTISFIILMLFLGMGIIGAASVFNPTRVIFSSSFILASLISILFTGVIYNGFNKSIQRLGFVVLLFLLFTQAFTTGALPDDHRQARMYLTTGEQEGKVFITENFDDDDIIYTDSYYTRVGFDPAADKSSGYWQRKQGHFRSYDDDVFDGQLGSARNETIAYRTDVNLYGQTGFGGYWTLDWEPIDTLESCYSRIYTNNNINIYGYNSC